MRYVALRILLILKSDRVFGIHNRGRVAGSAGLPQLLSCPLRGRVGSNIEVQDATPVMGQHQKHVKNLEADRGHREEINGESAGINRSEVGDERALRERSNEPLGPEFGVVVAVRQPTKHKTGA